MSKTHEHLEHAEHAQHHALNTFDRRVAVSMAIIAAVLAGISTAGHRKHNEVLQIQGEANRLRTEAAAQKVVASDLFAWYQSKRNRQATYETAAVLAAALPAGPQSESLNKEIANWKHTVERYKSDPEEQISRIEDQGRAAEAKAKELERQADARKAEAEHAHHQADRLDVGHVLAEIGLVVCSVSVLTKRRSFWLIGILAAVMALAVAGSSYMIADHAAHGETHLPNGGHGTGDHGPPKDKPGKDHAGEKPATDKSEKEKGHGGDKPGAEKAGH